MIGTSRHPTVVPHRLVRERLGRGYGVTVAFVDSGYHNFQSQMKNSLDQTRLLAQYDAIQREKNRSGFRRRAQRAKGVADVHGVSERDLRTLGTC